MRVLVLGAGVVGVTTAYYLWREGHEVTVVDRQPGPGLETSYGNAGGLCPSFAGPWAAPGMIAKSLRLALQPHSPISLRPRLDPRQWSWIARWLGQCNAASFRRNKLRMQRVAHYSMACLKDLAAEAGLDDFDFHGDGTLQVFRTHEEIEVARLAARTLQEFGVPCRLLDAGEVDAMEPAIAQRTARVIGALHLPADASGDSLKFCDALWTYLNTRGVQFLFGTAIQRLEHAADAICAVHTSAGRLTADAYVVALGSYAPLLLRPLGIALPLYPVKGYSITARLQPDGPDLRMALMDEHNKVMMSHLGNRIRAAGMAELTGYDLSCAPAHRDMLAGVLREFFPAGIDFGELQFWSGLRPMTPDGPPVLGPTRWRGLFLNSGHGSNGWTQACGTSRIVADLVSGRPSAIDLDGLTGARFGIAPA